MPWKKPSWRWGGVYSKNLKTVKEEISKDTRRQNGSSVTGLLVTWGMIILSKAVDTSGEMGVRAVVLSSQRNNNKKIEIHMEV